MRYHILVPQSASPHRCEGEMNGIWPRTPSMRFLRGCGVVVLVVVVSCFSTPLCKCFAVTVPGWSVGGSRARLE